MQVIRRRIFKAAFLHFEVRRRQRPFQLQVMLCNQHLIVDADAVIDGNLPIELIIDIGLDQHGHLPLELQPPRQLNLADELPGRQLQSARLPHELKLIPAFLSRLRQSLLNLLTAQIGEILLRDRLRIALLQQICLRFRRP